MKWSPFKRASEESKRYYLLPGQGGKAYRRKRNFILTWSVIAALLLSGVLTALLLFMNRPHH